VDRIDEAQVVVVGAGVVGSSIAYWLAKRGQQVILIDRMGHGAGTSTANFGLILTHVKEPLGYMELSLSSARLWPRMVEELGEDVELRMGRGCLMPCRTEAEYEKKAAMVERQKQSPLYRGRMLSPKEVMEIQPGISPRIAGASWGPDDGDCDPIKWVFALARGCRRLGVKLMTGTDVEGFDLDDNRSVKAVLTRKGKIATRIVVNAAGPWANALAEMVGFKIGIFPERGQVLITESAPFVSPTPMFGVRQMRNGQFHIGASAEEVGPNWSTSTEAAQKLARDGAALVPAVRESMVIRQFAGIRSMPRDGLPFIGPVPSVPGYYVAVGHSGNTLSPIYGKILSDLILDGRTTIPIEAYDPLRYDEKGKRQAGPDRKAY
jgi:glycine/D-amino acid oxidase-like deaminating enzyme